MAQSTTTSSVSFTPYAPLAAIGLYLRQIDFLAPIREHVKIEQKKLVHTPLDKLTDAFISILAGAQGLVEVNTRLHSDRALQEAFGRTSCAEQSTIQDTLNACTDATVQQMEQALTLIYRQHSKGYRHNYQRRLQILDVDMSGMPCGPKAALATKGYFANQRNRCERQLGRVVATRYGEIVSEQVFAGTVGLAAAFQPLVQAAEQVLGLARSSASAPCWKAALDLDWDDPAAHTQALALVLDSLEQFEAWLETQPDVLASQPAVLTSLAAADQIRSQDVILTETGTPSLRKGVASDRRISLEDSQMRHGRKSRSQLVDGYKRHVLRDLDSGLVPAVGITPANVPEAKVTDSISLDLHAQALTLRELHIDRAYLSSHLVRERDETLEISCRAWPVRQGAQFAKTAFVLDWEQGTLQCPDGVVLPFTAGSNVVLPADRCGGCALRPGCTTSKTGRSVSIHRDERLMQELRERH